MIRPEGARTVTDILVEAIENIDKQAISKVVVLAFDLQGNPVGWLSNVGDRTQRVGLIEIGKLAMLQDGD